MKAWYRTSFCLQVHKARIDSDSALVSTVVNVPEMGRLDSLALFNAPQTGISTFHDIKRYAFYPNICLIYYVSSKNTVKPSTLSSRPSNTTILYTSPHSTVRSQLQKCICLYLTLSHLYTEACCSFIVTQTKAKRNIRYDLLTIHIRYLNAIRCVKC